MTCIGPPINKDSPHGRIPWIGHRQFPESEFTAKLFPCLFRPGRLWACCDDSCINQRILHEMPAAPGRLAGSPARGDPSRQNHAPVVCDPKRVVSERCNPMRRKVPDNALASPGIISMELRRWEQKGERAKGRNDERSVHCTASTVCASDDLANGYCPDPGRWGSGNEAGQILDMLRHNHSPPPEHDRRPCPRFSARPFVSFVMFVVTLPHCLQAAIMAFGDSPGGNFGQASLISFNCFHLDVFRFSGRESRTSVSKCVKTF